MIDTDITDLYKLSVDVENPIFEGFALDKSPSLLGRNSIDDDLCPGYGITEIAEKWGQAKLRDVWEPLEVSGRVVPFNDFPGVALIYPAFSRRACDHLRDYLEPNGELLPLKTEIGEYYFYNITTISDALNVDESDCKYAPMSIRFFEFHRAKLKGLSIFRIYQWPIGTIVTNHFVERVTQAGLNGFEFTKIWPYTKGVNWRLEAKKQNVRDTIAENMKQNTLVIFLKLKKDKATRDEKKYVKQLQNQLDAQLVLQSIDASYFGSYEGIDIVDGEYRLFLSCPDVDALCEKLQPWLNYLEWPNGAYVMKRYGGMYDPDAEETLEQLK